MPLSLLEGLIGPLGMTSFLLGGLERSLLEGQEGSLLGERL